MTDTRAATIALNASDAITTSSFNSGVHWTGRAAPVACNAYQSATFLQNTTPISFANDDAGHTFTINSAISGLGSVRDIYDPADAGQIGRYYRLNVHP